jgi:glycosyltransferase involved in cell wall biosynthesis/O-antigen/teichoic acid export membrane protein
VTRNGHLTRRRRLSEALSASAVEHFWRQIFVLLVAIGLFNGSNYAFHVVISRLLGPSRYGALASLLAAVMVLSVPFGVLQTVIAQKTAALRARQRDEDAVELAAGAMKTLTPFAVLAALAMLLAAPLLALFLHISVGSAVLLAPYVAFSIIASVPLGALQGARRFGAIAALMVSTAAIRVGLGIAFVEAGFGVLGAVLATPLATMLTLPLGLRLARIGRSVWRQSTWSLEHLRGDFLTATLGLTSFWILAEVDVVLARHYLDHRQAGYYSSAGLLARALLFLPGAVSIVAFPRFVAARDQGEGHMRWLRLSLAGVGSLLAVGLPLLMLLRRPLVEAAFGSSFLPAAHLLLVLGPAMALLAFVGVLVYFHIAMTSRAYTVLLGAAAIEAALVAAWHESPNQIAIIVLGVNAVAAFVLLQAALSICRWRPALQRGKDAEPLKLAAPASVELSVVLPCHNAGTELANVLTSLAHRLEEIDSYEIIVVSDGSTDDTVPIAKSFVGASVRVLECAERSGKGSALKVGLMDARGAYVAFVDADGDIAADGIGPFLALMKLYEPDIVLGSKRHPLSEVAYPFGRRLLSWIYLKSVRLLFHLDVHDTLTGMRLIRRDVLAAVLPRMLEKRYAFDIEFLVVARSLGYKRVFEAPVRVDYKFASHVDLHALLLVFVDTLAIFYRHYILDTYRQAGRRPDLSRLAPGAPPFVQSESERRAGLVAATRRPARILFINWRDIKNPSAGGEGVFTHEVAKRWAARGLEVSLLTSKFDGAPRSEILDGVRIRRLGRLRNGTFHLLVQRELARLKGFDVVIDEINTAPVLTPLWRHRLPPTVALIHQLAADVFDAELPRPLARFGRWVEPRVLRLYRTTPVVTVSPSTQADLQRLGFADVDIVPEGVDASPQLDGLPKEAAPTFLFVGRLTSSKRPQHAVEAFARIRSALPDARLWVIGRGPLEDEIDAHLPDGVERLGYLPRAEVYERMARAHCLLVPSVREGWGLVVLEANSVGTPAVGYDVPGLRDSIRHDRTGALVPSGDPAGLADAATALVGDPERYASLRAEALSWARTFSWDRTADELLDIVMRSTCTMQRPLQAVEAPPSPSVV